VTVLRARLLRPRSVREFEFLTDAFIQFDESGIIREVGPYDGRSIDIDLRPGVVLPGFVDAHVHFPQTRIVGSATGPLLDWLQQSTFPEEMRFAGADHANRVADIFAASLAAAGTTSALVYGPVFPQASDALFRALDRRGQRAILGPVWMDEDCPEELRFTPEQSAEAVEGLVERWHGRDGRLEVAVIPRFALCCSARSMRLASAVATRHRLRVSTHLSENTVECQIARDKFSASDYLSVYEDMGLLVPGSVYAHCIHLSPDEWDRFAASGAVVAHCPDSNAFLGSGHMPVSAVRERGIAIAAGTDIAAGRSFRVSRTLSSAYDNGLATGVALDPAELLWWGTRGGAEALGLPHVGAVDQGFEADLQCVDVPEWAETADAVLASILFDHDAPRPSKTWVRGRLVWDRDQAGAWPWWPRAERR
jgi:guanine deaminase